MVQVTREMLEAGMAARSGHGEMSEAAVRDILAAGLEAMKNSQYASTPVAWTNPEELFLEDRLHAVAVVRWRDERNVIPLYASHLADNSFVEIDDGSMTYRDGSLSITVSADTATIYDTSKAIPARKVKLSYDEFWTEADDFLRSTDHGDRV